MKAAFFHDTPLIFENGLVYSRTLGTEVWDRYLTVFDELLVSTRIGNFSSEGMRVSSHPKVTFSPISHYHSSFSAIVNLRSIIKEVRATLNEVDCAIIRLPSVIGWIAIAVAKSMKKPYVIELAGCAWDSYRFHSISGKIIAPIGYLTTRTFVRKAKFVIYVTHEFLQRRYPTDGTGVAISNASIYIQEESLERRLSKIESMVTQNSFPNKRKIVIGSIGKIDLKYKGHISAVQAVFKLISKGYSVELEIVGGGNPAALQNEISKLGLDGSVKLIGPLSSSEVHQWLDTIDVYLHPSLTEGLPRSAVEALSHGLPSVLSAAGGQAELVDREFLFAPGDVQEMESVITELLENQNWDEIARSNFERSRSYTEIELQSKRNDILNQFVSSEVIEPKSP